MIERTEKRRLTDIDQCKGLAIFLVIVGHILPSASWLWANWFLWLNHTIYQFHMPFFMFLSGLVTLYTYRPLRSWEDYTSYASRRFRRFLPGYVFFALLTSIGKFVLARHVYVERPPDNLLNDWVRFAVRPLESSATNLWYIYVLIAYAAILPPLLSLARNNPVSLLPVAFVAHFVPLPDLFLLPQIAEYSFVFLLGGVVVRDYDRFVRHVDRWWRLWATVFLTLCVAWPFLQAPPVPAKFVIGMVSIPTLVGVVRCCWLRSGFLAMLGRYTYPIYLVNMLAIGGSKAIIFKFTSWDGARFLVVGPVLVCAGLLVPVVAKKYVFSRIPWLDRITT